MSKRWIWGMALICAVAWAQETPDRITVPFRDASKPRTLVVKLIHGGITVRGYAGKDVIVEGHGVANRNRRPSDVPEGMHRLDNNNSGLDVSEDNNVVTVRAGLLRPADLTIQVPTETSLRLTTMTGGKIEVDNVSGEIEAEDMNGAVTLTNVSGSVVANSMNGRVTVSLDHVAPNKTMSFSTMNGPIDVTLPADVKANLRLRSDNGDIWTDFDVKMEGSVGSTPVGDGRQNGGRHRVRVDRTMLGTINGGGPEMRFTTYNGNIVIHKK